MKPLFNHSRLALGLSQTIDVSCDYEVLCMCWGWLALCWRFLKITPKVQLNGFTLSMFFFSFSCLWQSFYYFYFTYSAFKYPHIHTHTGHRATRRECLVSYERNRLYWFCAYAPNQLQSNWNICQSIFHFATRGVSWTIFSVGLKWFAQFTRFARALRRLFVLNLEYFRVRFTHFDDSIRLVAIYFWFPTSKIDLSGSDRLKWFICCCTAAKIFSQILKNPKSKQFLRHFRKKKNELRLVYRTEFFETWRPRRDFFRQL